MKLPEDSRAELDLIQIARKKSKVAIVRNNIVIAILKIAFTIYSLVNNIYKYYTTKYPRGLA